VEEDRCHQKGYTIWFYLQIIRKLNDNKLKNTSSSWRWKIRVNRKVLEGGILNGHEEILYIYVYIYIYIYIKHDIYSKNILMNEVNF
jgi:hypothetical protein